MKAQRNYWVSNERGEKDPFLVNTIAQVTKIITGAMNHVLTESGHVAGGYCLDRADGRSVVSNGEFRLVNGKAKYFPDFVEIQ